MMDYIPRCTRGHTGCPKSEKERPCDECLRREVIECFEQSLKALPEDVGGFGEYRNLYVMGLSDAIRFSLEKNIEELQKLSGELKENGMGLGV
ncbi:MAG: hypothetical protein M0R06_10210 [Sphaerochaeta sp.]|nr:hypothetical protein [Sphaerochaeta sp.]MDD2730578.1 hypothetical protein [Candidatus Portnoybacteria bacterium]